jgi:signal transduction histidine kinase/ActR/RegA family two-component response regulator
VIDLSFEERYAAALLSHVTAGEEAVLHEAYELGREALKQGTGVLDLTMLHHRALAKVSTRLSSKAAHARMEQAAEFLAECLSPFEMTLRGYRDANERLIAEMAERQRAEEALRQAQRLQVVGQLAGGVAHDFNNLLTVVLGNLDVAFTAVSADEGMRKILGRAIAAAERGAKVTRQLLAFSRKQLLHPEVIEPSERLREAISMLERSLGDNIEIKADIRTDLWAVEIDPAQLELALLNLGLNARDAMTGGGVLRVSAFNQTVDDARLGITGDYVVIEIADTGAGIPAEVLPKVFEPYFTTKDVGAGSGLGLSQVHGFAHQSGGVVDIESTLGVGTTVRLFLRASHAVKTAAVERLQTSARQTATILLVEDEASVAELAASVLQSAGFEVKLADRAQIALDLLSEGTNVDLILSDIKMPEGISGIELAETIKSRFPHIPVLLTTGYADAAANAAAKGLKIIAKPYRKDELGRSVAAFLGMKPPENGVSSKS